MQMQRCRLFAAHLAGQLRVWVATAGQWARLGSSPSSRLPASAAPASAGPVTSSSSATRTTAAALFSIIVSVHILLVCSHACPLAGGRSGWAVARRRRAAGLPRPPLSRLEVSTGSTRSLRCPNATAGRETSTAQQRSQVGALTSRRLEPCTVSNCTARRALINVRCAASCCCMARGHPHPLPPRCHRTLLSSTLATTQQPSIDRLQQ